jgi:hypothetical protein
MGRQNAPAGFPAARQGLLIAIGEADALNLAARAAPAAAGQRTVRLAPGGDAFDMPFDDVIRHAEVPQASLDRCDVCQRGLLPCSRRVLLTPR